MSIDPNLLIAAKMIHDECVKYGNCDCCKIKFACSFSGIPSTWEITDPPPEPTERQRIEWLRMLPDNELLKAIVYMTEYNCLHCVDRYNANCCGCAEGLVPWWQEKITLAQFRKDAELR